MKRLLLGVFGLLLAAAAFASGSPAREPVEASMVVTGTLTVAPDGTVGGYTLDRPERIPPLVTEVIGKTLAHWKFEPVLRDGKPVIAKAKMSLRLVARPIADGKFEVGVRSAYFGDSDASLVRDMSARPRYLESAVRARVQGTVYLVLRLDRAGKVADAVAAQVNLRLLASETRLKRWRKLLAAASLDAARRWSFAPAVQADTRAYRVVRVPVAYSLHQWGTPKPDTYGQWIGYVPGPVEPVPWLDADRMLGGGNDALPEDGGIYGQPSLSLLTPLDRS